MVAEPRISSTSGITGTGLKKCMPTKRARLASPTAAARRSMAMDDVLDAKMAPAGAISSSAVHRRVLTSTSSNTASMTRSASAAIARSDDPVRRARMRLPVVGCQLALRDGAIEVARDARQPGLGPGELGLVDRDLLAHGRVHLGDPVPHEPGARHEDALDGHACSSMGPRPPAYPAGWTVGTTAVRRATSTTAPMAASAPAAMNVAG